jgi:hypothetical protein
LFDDNVALERREQVDKSLLRPRESSGRTVRHEPDAPLAQVKVDFRSEVEVHDAPSPQERLARRKEEDVVHQVVERLGRVALRVIREAPDEDLADHVGLLVQ